jgi:hypothetical protein
MMEQLASFFPSTAEIQRSTQVVDGTSHEVTFAWATLGAYTGLACSCGPAGVPAGGREVQAAIRGGVSYAESMVTISVASEIPLAKASDRVVVTGDGAGTYDILAVHGSSHGVLTRISAKVVTTD